MSSSLSQEKNFNSQQLNHEENYRQQNENSQRNKEKEVYPGEGIQEDGNDDEEEMITNLQENDDEAEKRKRRRAKEQKRRQSFMSPKQGFFSPRHSLLSEAGRRASRPTALSNHELKDLFQNCIELSSENKITVKNTWNLKLIDHIQDVMQSSLDENKNNFQMASCTLDASVKIYSARVDSVHSKTFQVLGGLNRTTQPSQNGDDADDGDEDEAKSKNKKKNDKKKPKTKTKTIEENLENINLKKMELDTALDTFFHFRKTGFDQGGVSGLLLNNIPVSGEGQLLLDTSAPATNEEIDEDDVTNTAESRVFQELDSSSVAPDSGRRKSVVTLSATKMQPFLSAVDETPCTTMDNPNVLYSGRQTQEENYRSVKQNLTTEFDNIPSIDFNSVHNNNNENENENGFTQNNNQDNNNDDDDDDELEAFAPTNFGDIHNNNNNNDDDDLFEPQNGNSNDFEMEMQMGMGMNNTMGTGDPDTATIDDVLAVGDDQTDDAQPVGFVFSDYSYFDSKTLHNWAGVNPHWKLASVASSSSSKDPVSDTNHYNAMDTDHNNNNNNNDNGNTQNKKKNTKNRKPKFTLDFTTQIDQQERKTLSKAFHIAKTPSKFTMTKSTLFSKDRHVLPEDEHYDLNTLLTPFTVPQTALLRRKMKKNATGDQSNLDQVYTAMQTNDPHYSNDINGDGHADLADAPDFQPFDAPNDDDDEANEPISGDAYGGYMMDFEGLDTAANQDGEEKDQVELLNENYMDGIDGEEAFTANTHNDHDNDAEEGAAIDKEDDNELALIEEPRKAEKIDVEYATRVKRVDVRRLKDSLWNGIQTRPEHDAREGSNDEDDTEQNDDIEDIDISEEEKHALRNGNRFSALMRDLPSFAQCDLKDVSVQFCFICLLHLANEQNLSIQGNKDLTDLYIASGSNGFSGGSYPSQISLSDAPHEMASSSSLNPSVNRSMRQRKRKNSLRT